MDLSQKNIEDKIQFLNDWKCRTDVKMVTPSLKQVSQDFKIKLGTFNTKNWINNDIRIKEVTEIYEVLNTINGLGPTGISKYLHMHNTDFFIMWDNQIFRDYFHIKTVLKSTATSFRYYYFMKRMKEELLEAIQDFDENYSKDGLIGFKKKFNNESFPRILDKYNYVTRKKEKKMIIS